ncbi:MAG: hypothetical protein IPM16_20845 [Chloroflexi bacterium]|nr:hypothetical protein [Chloroflexota bacterium]
MSEIRVAKATILFTQDLRGDLNFVPKLGRVLWRLRAEDQNNVTVDLGAACDRSVWHCDATDGRSMLIALDGMNYAAANTEGLEENVRPHLSRALVGLRAVDRKYPAKLGPFQMVTHLPPEGFPGASLVLVLAPQDHARVEANAVFFPRVPRYAIGRIRVALLPKVEIVSVETLPVPPDTPPDPTLSAMVGFIESEARQYAEKRKRPI